MGRLLHRRVAVAAGCSLVDAIAAPLLAGGMTGGAVSLAGLHLSPFAFVRPAEAADAAHAAYYSDTFRPAATVVVESGTATIGVRDGKPFLHAHALWRDGRGHAAVGHILPLETCVAVGSDVDAWGTGEAGMVALPDPETNFTLFRPRATAPVPADPDGVLGWLRPGEDLLAGVEALCQRHHIIAAIVHSVIGSIVGARFEDGRTVDTVPTELFVRHGQVVPDATGRPRAELDIVLVDKDGGIHTGRLSRNSNPVLICAEVVLQRRG